MGVLGGVRGGLDISDDRIRTRIGKHLLGYGDRVQKSVFEIAVKHRRELDTLREELMQIAEEEGNIRLYRMCENCRQNSCMLDGAAVGEFPALVIV